MAEPTVKYYQMVIDRDGKFAGLMMSKSRKGLELKMESYNMKYDTHFKLKGKVIQSRKNYVNPLFGDWIEVIKNE